MSFALTERQIVDGSKSVTRRVGWTFLRVGEQVRPVRKCMGLKPGEKMAVLCDPLTVASVRREPLHAMLGNNGREECRREGFPDMSPEEFVSMFCRTHRGCTPDTEITRIEFEPRRQEDAE